MTSDTVNFDEQAVDVLFTELDQCHLPGVAVGIAIHGMPVYRKGFGLANLELPVVLSPTIRMRIASITKHFACLAYMLCCEDGKAGIDDPIGAHVPELHAVARKVTFRQLMGNTSGLRNAHDICWQFSGTGQPVSSADLLSFYCDIDDVNAAPGSAWIYNNGGFLLLSVAIERITGQPLESVLRERIFDPVGMYSTLLRRWDTDFMPNSASLHMLSPAGGYEKSHFGTAWAGEGGMVSTVDDMLRWLAHMNAPFVGSVSTWNAMRAPQILANGTATGYGLGLITGHYRGAETLYHLGGWLGGNSQMLKVPAAGLDVVIMSNRSDVSAPLLAEKILDTCLAGLDPVKEQPDGPFASGVFRSPRTGRVIQLFANEGQQMASVDGMDMPVEADDSAVLWPAGIWRYVKQAMVLDGDQVQPDSIRLSDFGNLDVLTRAQVAGEPDLGTIAGRYRSRTTGTEVTIHEADDGPRMSTVGRFGSAVYLLECLAEGIWRAKSTNEWWGGILSFDVDALAFRFFTHGTWALTFSRAD